MSSAIQVSSVIYPESDGKPMGETDLHIEETIRLRQLLKRFYAGQSVYVSGSLLVFYQQGDPKKFVVPDVYAVKALEPRNRRFYKLWVERRPPDVIFEVTSKKTKKHDTVTRIPESPAPRNPRPLCQYRFVSSESPERFAGCHCKSTIRGSKCLILFNPFWLTDVPET
jgi:hypothetical protein